LETDHLAQGLLEELLPGPVTVISWTKSGADMPSGINPGRRLLGVRVPSACFARAVARQYGHALALTSANQSGDPSTLNVDEFLEIWDDCSLIFDGGEIPSSGLGSTIVNLSVPGEMADITYRYINRYIELAEQHTNLQGNTASKGGVMLTKLQRKYYLDTG